MAVAPFGGIFKFSDIRVFLRIYLRIPLFSRSFFTVDIFLQSLKILFQNDLGDDSLKSFPLSWNREKGTKRDEISSQLIRPV